MIDDLGFNLGRAFRPDERNAVQGVAGLGIPVFLALMAVSPEDKEGKIDAKAEFIITMDWSDGHPDDLDLYAQDPLGNIAWDRYREAGFMVLERDDRGGTNDDLRLFRLIYDVRLAERMEVAIKPLPMGNRRVAAPAIRAPGPAAWSKRRSVM